MRDTAATLQLTLPASVVVKPTSTGMVLVKFSIFVYESITNGRGKLYLQEAVRRQTYAVFVRCFSLRVRFRRPGFMSCAKKL